MTLIFTVTPETEAFGKTTKLHQTPKGQQREDKIDF